jgi:hypothetical protein
MAMEISDAFSTKYSESCLTREALLELNSNKLPRARKDLKRLFLEYLFQPPVRKGPKNLFDFP